MYRDPHAAADCFGVPDVDVELTDADGRSWLLTTNDAGNFWLAAGHPVSFPYTARVLDGDHERPMLAPQSVGSCASCHTRDGASAAPGRILAP